MFIWDWSWGSRNGEVTARTAVGARRQARKALGRTMRRPEDSEIQVFIRRLPDGTPVKPEPSAADAVVARIMSAPTPKRQHEDW